MKFVLISLLASLVDSNVYLHSPRGSNNRLNENSAQNKNNMRLFQSNNNRRGGYNVGDKTDEKFRDEAGQYNMQYFQSGVEGDSYLTVEWTNLVGCGYDEDGHKIQNCDIVIQTICQSDEVDGVPQEDTYTLRNGKSTETMEYERDPEDLYDPQGQCFIDGHDRDLPRRKSNIPDNIGNSLQYCLDQCESSGYIYAGIQYQRECWCGNDLGKYGIAPLEECNLNCRDGSGNKCGGGWRQNIYLSSSMAPGPEDLSDPQGKCFIDRHNRDLNRRQQNIPNDASDSIQNCLDKCNSLSFAYAGIQYQSECWCGNSYGKYGEAPLEECNLNCRDGSGNKCGGGWRQNIYLSSSSSPGPQEAAGKQGFFIDETINNDDYNAVPSDDQFDDYKVVHLTSQVEDEENDDQDSLDSTSSGSDDDYNSASDDEDNDVEEFSSESEYEGLNEPGVYDEDPNDDGCFGNLITNFFRKYTTNTNFRRTAALGTRAQTNERRQSSMDRDIGLHEPWEFYDRCDPTFGTRYGMECKAEREQWPDPSISPWVDVALFSDDKSNVCSDDIETLNHRQFFECVEFYDEAPSLRKHKSIYKTQPECEDNGGDWLGFYKVGDVHDEIASKTECLNLNGGLKQYVWGRPMIWKDIAEDKLSDETCIALPAKTECLEAPNTRDGYLGDVDGGRNTPRFHWKLPHHEEDKRCVFRIRYIISSDEEEIPRNDNVFYPDDTDGLSLAPAKKQIVFEDRSHVFKLLQRPAEIPDDLTIHNLVVRGKRGNIVQTYPAVEYDFVPNRLTISEGEAIHVQWTGSNSHNNGHPGGDGQTGDAGEGRGGTDRNNFIQLVDRKANLVAPDHKHTLFKNAEWVWSSHEMGDPENHDFNLALSMATSGYYQCEHDEECEESFDNTLNDQLNNAPASYHGNLFIPAAGEYHYKCMRNDNFSNRAQKGTITVEKWVEIANMNSNV